MALTKVTQDMVDFTVGGGGMPKTEIFTSSGTWLVPQEVQDKIASDGYATVGLFMVGGGGSSAPGEVVNKTIKLTASNYDPQSGWASSTQPEITINIGAVGGNSSFTKDPSSGSSGSESPSISNIGRNQTQSFSLASPYSADSNGYPLISQLILGVKSQSLQTAIGKNDGDGTSSAGSVTVTGFTTNPTLNVSLSGLYNIVTITFPTPSPWDATLAGNGLMLGYGSTTAAIRLAISWNLSTKQFDITNNTPYSGTNGVAVFDGTGSDDTTISYLLGDVGVINARHGNSLESSQFLNNTSSTEGYFGGFARNGGSTPNSGQPGQAGYVQIYF